MDKLASEGTVFTNAYVQLLVARTALPLPPLFKTAPISHSLPPFSTQLVLRTLPQLVHDRPQPHAHQGVTSIHAVHIIHPTHPCRPSQPTLPTPLQCFNFLQHFRETDGQNWTSLPGHFKNNGFLTLGAGKTFVVALLFFDRLLASVPLTPPFHHSTIPTPPPHSKLPSWAAAELRWRQKLVGPQAVAVHQPVHEMGPV